MTVGYGFIADKGKIRVPYDSDLRHDDGCDGTDWFAPNEYYEVGFGLSDDQNEIYVDIDPGKDDGYEIYLDRATQTIYVLNNNSTWVNSKYFDERSLKSRTSVWQSNSLIFPSYANLREVAECALNKFEKNKNGIIVFCYSFFTFLELISDEIDPLSICGEITSRPEFNGNIATEFLQAYIKNTPSIDLGDEFEDPMPWY